MTDQIDHGRASGASDTTTGNAAVADLGAPPSLAHPKDVLDDATLSVEQKRSIFASWLSDVHAVPGAPRWRELDNGAFVDIHEVEDALRVLDDMERGWWERRVSTLIFAFRAAQAEEGMAQLARSSQG